MVDKPKGKTEILMERFFGWFKSKISQLERKTAGHRQHADTFRKNHPRIARTMVVTVCTLTLGLVIVGFATPKTVTVKIDDSLETKIITYETTSRRVDTFIKNHQIDYVYGVDIIDTKMYAGISDNMEITIQKAAQIPVTADGETKLVTTLPTTTGDLLKKLGIKVGENDIVEPALDYVLRKGDSLMVKRVTTDYVTEEVETGFEQLHTPDYGMAIGKTAVLSEGAKGREKRTYLATYIDGVESARALQQTEVLQQKQDRVIAYGMNMSFGMPSGLKYKNKISGVRAVSYHFSGNPKGAYGKPCTYGTVAVDPKVIPLGSLLYIEGYGYAVANDVGTAIKGNTVDLYMEDIKQCYKWGARTVNVYVIE